MLFAKPLNIWFIYNKNKKGPSTEPRGTPALIDLKEDENPSTTTYYFYYYLRDRDRLAPWINNIIIV